MAANKPKLYSLTSGFEGLSTLGRNANEVIFRPKSEGMTEHYTSAERAVVQVIASSEWQL